MIITKEREGLYKAVQSGISFYGWSHESAIAEILKNWSVVLKANKCRHIMYCDKSEGYRKCMACEYVTN